MKPITLPVALSSLLLATPSHAFFDEIVEGMTSVTNNLIDSGESMANNTITTTSSTLLLLSRDIGKMADRIDRMADKIGLMADRIVFTESMMATFAHKVVDNGSARLGQVAKPAGNAPVMVGCSQPAEDDIATTC